MEPSAASSNATGQGTTNVEVWNQFRLWQQRCTALRMELTSAGVDLGPDCFLSHDLAPAPVDVKLEAQKYCFECLQRYRLQLANRQSSQQNFTFLHNSVTIENSSNLNVNLGQQHFASLQLFPPALPYPSYHHFDGNASPKIDRRQDRAQPQTRANSASLQTNPAAMPAVSNHSWTPPSAQLSESSAQLSASSIPDVCASYRVAPSQLIKISTLDKLSCFSGIRKVLNAVST